jgi:PIN domain nuclease of toxin-antitoxin system
MPHLLDTSAVLAHFLDEPGSDVVSRILAGGKKKALLCAPSWAELERRLAELVPDADEAERVWMLYTQELCGFCRWTRTRCGRRLICGALPRGVCL